MGRRQKVTSDVLGRAVKAEVFDANGQVYTTTASTYNALDQTTNVRQYQGNDQSSVYQDRVMTYDGYGRLATRKLPQQSGPTVYSYYADDEVQSVTDARGAVATYSYNNRHLVTGIAYSAPAGITATANVTYGYDQKGNRTSMTDGMGSTTYHYDQLSRMDWEERTFTGLSGAYRLSYTYNLAGQVTSITDPFNQTINYARDSVGRMTAVSGPSIGGITDYASDIKYRAWGALKSLSYGNTRTLLMSYNSRMQLTHFEVPGVMSSDYQYYADGRVSSATDLLDARFNRNYSYDLMGRLRHAMTAETGPYDQFYEYDVWGNLTSRSSRHWSEYYGEATTYVNNRSTNTSWQYDADGRMIKKGLQEFTFDAAGHMIRMYNPLQRTGTNAYGLTMSYAHDGDGQQVRETKYSPNYFPQTTYTYSVRSSVMGGKVITELNGSGAKQLGYVLMGSTLLMRGGEWVHENPVTGSQRRTISTGAIRALGSVELDPLGTDVGLSDPYVGAGQDTDQPYPRHGEPVNQFGGCSVDGVPAPCGYVAGLLNSGSAVQCANGNCGYRTVINRRGQPRIALLGFNPNTGQLSLSHYERTDTTFIFPDGTREVYRGTPYTVWDDLGSTSGMSYSHRPGQQIDGPTPLNVLAKGLAFGDADTVLLLDKKCRSFFTAGNRSLDEVRNILKQFGQTATLDTTSKYSAIAGTTNSGQGANARVTLYQPFFANDGKTQAGIDAGYHWSPTSNRYEELFTGLYPRQYRALTVLHELAHALGLIPSDKRSADPSGKQSPANDAKINEECGAGLNNLPDR